MMSGVKDSHENRKIWNELYDRVVEFSSGKMRQEEGISKTLTGLRRPKNEVLNILIDAIILKFTDLEDELAASKTGHGIPLEQENNEESSSTDYEEHNSESLLDSIDILDASAAGQSVMHVDHALLSPDEPDLFESSCPTTNQFKKFTPSNKTTHHSDSADIKGIELSKAKTVQAGPNTTAPSPAAGPSAIASTSKNSTTLPSATSHSSASIGQWIDLDLRKAMRLQMRGGNRQNDQDTKTQKKMKQMTFDTLKNKPLNTKDVSQDILKEVRAGVSSPQRLAQPSSSATRNRDEDDSTRNDDKRENFFQLSPIEVASSKMTNPMFTKVPPPRFPAPAAGLLNTSEPTDINEKGKSDKANQNPEKTPQISKFTQELLKDFDKIPSRKPSSPNFRYKEPVVRNKIERAKLPGWDCEECRGYYEALESELDKDEIQRLKDKCSKHRSKFMPISNTPENFWYTEIPSTEELYAEGYILVGTPHVLNPKYRRPKPRGSDSEEEEEGS